MIFYLDQIERSTGTFKSGKSKSFCWSGQGDNECVSISNYVELNSDRLRNRYLAFVFNLGEKYIGDKKVKKYFELERGFNLWWMSLIVEKSPAKSPRIYDCLKMLAFEEILLNERPDKLIFRGSDRDISDTMLELCSNLQISYEWEKTNDKTKALFFNSLPHFLQASLWFSVNFFKKLKFIKTQKRRWFHGRNTVFFISYLIHLSTNDKDKNRYYSKFWETLPEKLHSLGIHTNWLHHYIAHPQVTNVGKAKRVIEDFNTAGSEEELHCLLDSYSTLSVYFRSFEVYFRNYLRYLFSEKNNSILSPSNSNVTFRFLLKFDWESSFIGKVALENIHFCHLLDKAFSDVPEQKLGFYLQENQGWERALINAWRINGHKKLIGVAHSTIRYWDLRYFEHPDSFELRHGEHSQPRPDQVAVNGPHAYNCYLQQAYPQNEILKVEALRYLKEEDGEVIFNRDSRVLRILLCGDIDIQSTEVMMRYAETAYSILKKKMINVQFVLKPHPSSRIDFSKYNIGNISETSAALSKSLLASFDILIAAGMTSAAIDGYIVGLRIIVTLTGQTINLSPLRGVQNVTFVQSGNDMELALENSLIEDQDVEKIDFFWNNKDLALWLQTINNELIIN